MHTLIELALLAMAAIAVASMYVYVQSIRTSTNDGVERQYKQLPRREDAAGELAFRSASR